ncbi:GNAT family N-acetyltransferase [Candidatus Neomarinimicrobiota bacterium]
MKPDSRFWQPLIPERWDDFEALLGPKGAYGGCWCMWWRTSRSQFDQQQGNDNRLAMKGIVDSGEIPGILLYEVNKPIGWCSVAPRENFASLNRSRILKPIDHMAVWSIVCMYVAKDSRRKGIMLQIIRAAIEYVGENFGQIIEAYPTIPKTGQLPPVSSYMGFPEVFKTAGFVECSRPSPSKLVMRYYLEPHNPSNPS